MILCADILFKEVPVWSFVLAICPIIWQIISTYFKVNLLKTEVDKQEKLIIELRVKQDLNNNEMVKSIHELHKIIVELRTEIRVRHELQH